jgi:predicted Zn-dependent peptidase
MLQNSLLDEEELGRERGVVLQEIGQALDTPDDVVFDHFQATAYPDQALGRPVLGSAETVSGLERKSLVEYLERHYGASRMVLAAAGRVNHDHVVEMAASLFGNLPSLTDRGVEPARYQGGDFRDDRDLEQLHLVIGFDGIGVHDPDFYASSVFSTLLGGGMSSRLFQEVREKRGLVYSIYSFSGTYRDGGLFGIYAGTGAAEAAELIPLLCDQVCDVALSVTEDEVRRARAQLKTGTLMAQESTMSRCEQLGQQLLVFGRPISTPEIVRRIEEVDVAAVQRVARRLRVCQPTVTALGPLAHLASYDEICRRLV